MKVQVKTITPALAKRILAVQEERIAKGKYKQRHLDDRAVTKYATDMKAGNWLLNGQGITFDSKGNLVDGRHRLWAIVRSGVTIKILACYGAKNFKGDHAEIKVIDTIDCGRPRTVGNQMSIDGVVNANLMSSSTRIVAAVCLGSHNRKLSTPMVKGIYGMYGDHFDTIFKMLHSNPRISRAYLVAPFAMWHAVHPLKAKAFVNDLVELSGLTAGSPVLALKKYLDNALGARKTNNYEAVCAAIKYSSDEEKVTGFLRGSKDAVHWLAKIQGENFPKVLDIIGVEHE